MPDAPAAGALRGGPAALPPGVGSGGVAEPRSDPAATAPRRGGGLARRGRAGSPRAGGARRGRGGRSPCTREPLPVVACNRRAGVRVTETTYLQAITNTLAHAMRTDPRV